MTGIIKLHRQITEWEWYTDIPVRILFEHCLFKANYKEKKWKGVTVEIGSFITSYENLAFETGLTVQQVRTALDKLKSTGEITYKSTSRYSIITVNSWNKYQTDNTQDNKQTTNNQQTNNKQITTTSYKDSYKKNIRKEEREERENINKDSYLFTQVKKVDPFINPIKTFFQEQYTKIMGKSPRLSLIECNRLIELASENEDIEDIIPIAIKRLKSIDFKDIQFTPSASWLLKGNNFERVINGEFEPKKTEYDRLKEKFCGGAG